MSDPSTGPSTSSGPHSEQRAADILNHYFAALARQSGMRWTAANSADIQRAAELLSESALDEIPPFTAEEAPAGRDTVIFERQPPTSADQFRQARELSENEAARRMLRTNGR